MSAPETTRESAVADVFDGRVAWIFGDDFDIDLIIGVQNIKSYDTEFLLSVCMDAYEEGFAAKVRPGDILVAGRNFGYGHPHYPPMVAMRAAGIVAIVAESYAPGFWRGETFNGMPLVRCPGITSAVERWDRLRIDWQRGEIENVRSGERLEAEIPPERVQQIWRAGGSIPLLRAEHARVNGRAGRPADEEGR
jgi:3-isopropylmalate/(R)-2-methylmalate dehydratase small subunit